MKIIPILLFLILTTAAKAVDIKLIQTFTLSQDKVIVEGPVSLQVTDDDIFYVTDLKAGNIKIYDHQGKFLSTYGTKGAGPGEFMIPVVTHYSNGLLCVIDFGKRKIIVMERDGKAGLKEKTILPCRSAGDDIIIANGRVLVSGFIHDDNGKSFHLYSRNMSNEDDVVYLLPSEMKFGCKTYKEYRSKLKNTFQLSSLGPVSYCDVGRKYIYTVWHANLNISRINRVTKEITTFGHTTANYTKPYATKKMERARVTRNSKLSTDKKKMSFIKALFVNDNHVFVYYDKPQEKSKTLTVVQVYDTEGKYIKEISLDNRLSNLCFFRKSDNTLFCTHRTEDVNNDVVVAEYRVVE